MVHGWSKFPKVGHLQEVANKTGGPLIFDGGAIMYMCQFLHLGAADVVSVSIFSAWTWQGKLSHFFSWFPRVAPPKTYVDHFQ